MPPAFELAWGDLCASAAIPVAQVTHPGTGSGATPDECAGARSRCGSPVVDVECGGKVSKPPRRFAFGAEWALPRTGRGHADVRRRYRRFALPPHSIFVAGQPHGLQRSAACVTGIGGLPSKESPEQAPGHLSETPPAAFAHHGLASATPGRDPSRSKLRGIKPKGNEHFGATENPLSTSKRLQLGPLYVQLDRVGVKVPELDG